MDPRYKDILNIQWPVEKKPDAMPRKDRAAQFAPFAALTGYDSMIEETRRETQSPVFLTEESLETLNRTLNLLQRDIAQRPRVRMTVYYDDERKAGGRFQKVEGNLKRIDTYEGGLILTDGREIPFFRIVELEYVEPCE